MDSTPTVVVECPVCASQLRIPVAFLGKEGTCKTCGSRFTPAPPRPPESTPAAIRPTTSGNTTRRWAVLLALVFVPMIVLVPLSVWVGAAGNAFSLRVCVMNMLMVLLLSYCLIAGLYDPDVLGRLFNLPIERRHIAAVFAPSLLIEVLCALGTYSP